MTAPLQSLHLGDDRLDDFVDGLLDRAEREATAAHLSGCASCSARLDELRTLLTRSAEMRRPVEPPAELWPLVVASTTRWPLVRRRVLRSLKVPLAVAALVLVALSSAATAWVVTRASRGNDVAAVVLLAVLREDADIDRALAAKDHAHGPVAQARIDELRRRLSVADAAVRNAGSDETLYRALAARERLLVDVRAVLGIGPRPPRAPVAP